MKKKLVITVGNGLMGDDGAGVLLAKMLNSEPIDGWDVLNGGSAPENILHQVRMLAPDYVLLVDAADMDLPQGSIRKIEDRKLEDPFLLTTHTLPLSYIIESLREFVPKVDLLGIQPDIVAFGYPMSPLVTEAVAQVYADIQNGMLDWEYA